MPEHDDLDSLRAADPVDLASLPSPSGPEARALFERITMDDELRVPAENRAGIRRRAGIAVAAAALIIAGVAGAVTLASDDGDDGDVVAEAPEESTPDVGGAVSPGGLSTASCVEVYDETTLANREVGFDGTVEAVDGDSVRFSVNEWYRGGDGDSVSLNGASTLGGVTSSGAGIDLTPGTRLLVAGDGGFAWSCGFTQPYDAAVAEQWRDVFSS